MTDQNKETVKMTREEKIDAIANTIEGWDLSTLILFAQDSMRLALEGATDEQLELDYLMCCEPE